MKARLLLGALMIGVGLIVGRAVGGQMSEENGGVGSESLYSMADRIADEYGVDRALVKAVTSWENRSPSVWNASAINISDPSYGVMQVTPYIGWRFGVIKSEADALELLDPEKCFKAGCAFLKYLLDRYTFDDSIQIYNLGESKFWNGYRVAEYLAGVRGYYEQFKSS